MKITRSLAPLGFLAILVYALTSSIALANDHFDSRSRERLVNLKGTWHFSIGDDVRWAKSNFDDSEWSDIEVPNYWEYEGYRDYNGYAWYRRSFTFNDDATQLTYLVLGQVDDVDEVFVNGRRIGGTGHIPPNYVTAWNRDRLYALPAGTLQKGKDNVIAVRVYDGAMNGGIVGHSIGIYTSHIPLPDVDLAGDWQFQAGDNLAWKEPQIDESKFTTITVPAYWEYVGHGDLHGFAWYRKTFSVTRHSDDETMVLMLGKIDDTDEVYLNGTKIGSTGNLTDADRHSGVNYYNENRGYYFPASLLKKENVLAVRVYDFGGRGGIYEGPIGIIGQTRYIDYWETMRQDHNDAGGVARALLHLLTGDRD